MAVRDESRKRLPRGTVTLLFADVEGSTRLLQALRGEYSRVRTRMREIVRSTASQHGGEEVDWAGDGAFLAFERAHDAVVAAVEVQRALEREPWPEDAVVRVRMGLHTGEPDLDDQGYVGIDVHIAARICAAAHGGQVVVSRTTRNFVGDEPRDGLSFRPLGSHRLKDVPGPEQLFQLFAPGLSETFPPLRTLGGATLPALHHRLVGRRRDLTATLSLFARPEVRLVTITGPGGAGKSRLALEAAALLAVERPVHLVGLAPVSDPELVPAAIAQALGVRETAGRSLTETISDTLSGTRALLYLDNLEHLATAARHVALLLDRAPDLDVLTTSRAPLRLSGEHVVPLDPLTVHDAATLFAELAAARGIVLREDTVPAVREICRRLDGLPLAIELVAARLAVLPPAQLLAALDQGLALDLEGPVDLPERQRTLRATIEWSYGLLSESQRELHQVLAVFAGGCTFEDARALAGSKPTFFADLEALVTGSLLRTDVTDGEVRLSLLETVREDAVARLVAEGRFDDLRRRHAKRFVELASFAEHELAGPSQAEWLDRLDLELDNLRIALDWCFTSGRIEDGLKAVASLSRFWRARGHVSEGRRWLALGLALGHAVPPDVRADALRAAAHQADAQSDWNAAVPLLEEALALFRESDRGREVTFVLSELGYIAHVRGDPDRAAALCEEALAVARDLDDAYAISSALSFLGEIRSLQGEHDRALAHHEEAVAVRRTLGDPYLVSAAVYNLGVAAFQSGDLARARLAVEEALTLARELGETIHTAAALFVLAELDLLEGDVQRAETGIRESLALYTGIENDRDRAECIAIMACVAVANGSFDEAATLLGAAETLRADSPMTHFERVALERFLPLLEAALDTDELTRLKGKGAARGFSPELELAVTRAEE